MLLNYFGAVNLEQQRLHCSMWVSQYFLVCSKKTENGHQVCLKNHEIRVACLEKHIGGDVCMTTILKTP